MFTGLTVTLALIALACGIFLIIWAMRNEGKGIKLAKIFGYIISIIAILIIIVTTVTGVFEAVTMKNMMENGCPMCKKMQQGTSDKMETKKMMNNGMERTTKD